MHITINQHQVYCEFHRAYVESWEARIVDENNIRKQRPAENDMPRTGEYTACVDCLAEEIHPLDN